MLPGQITSLHAEEASLRCENSQLDSEIQLLRQKLQSLPDLHDSQVMQLHSRLLFKKEARCLQSKKLLIMCKELNSVCQIRNLSKKRAGDLSEELKTTAACHRQWARLCVLRAGPCPSPGGPRDPGAPLSPAGPWGLWLEQQEHEGPSGRAGS